MRRQRIDRFGADGLPLREGRMINYSLAHAHLKINFLLQLFDLKKAVEVFLTSVHGYSHSKKVDLGVKITDLIFITEGLDCSDDTIRLTSL